MNIKLSVLFIDSDQGRISKVISSLPSPENFSFSFASSKKDLTDLPDQKSLDIIFLDVTFMSSDNGLNMLRELNCKGPRPLVIAVLPQNSRHLTEQIIDINPFFYIYKPYEKAEIDIALKRAADRISFFSTSPDAFPENTGFNGIIGRAAPMLSLFDMINRVAEDDFATVLIRGESGTGKELVAKAIHARSKRSKNNFVPVNCAAIPDELLESELFGYTKGSFTGAVQNKQGRIQYADKGTLFLDEIGDMKPSLQAKLLRVLQEKEFEPIGGLQAIPVDTRILAATHCDLEQLVKEGKFREDLYYRLSVVPLNIPPLKDRKQDIPLLIESFIYNYSINRGRNPFSFSPQALQLLLKYNWRGNVRELENLIQHMSILFAGRTIGVTDLPEKFFDPAHQCLEEFFDNAEEKEQQTNQLSTEFPFTDDIFLTPESELDFNKLTNEFETKLIVRALHTTGGNKKEAARILKLKRTTLLEKIKKKKLLDYFPEK